MSVFRDLNQHQLSITSIFEKMTVPNSTPDSITLFKLDASLIDEVTNFVNSQFNMFDTLKSCGYADIVEPMMSSFGGIRKTLIAFHEHQDLYKSPKCIEANLNNYHQDIDKLKQSFSNSIENHSIKYADILKDIIKEARNEHPQVFQKKIIH